jgi:hypothetical protein
LLAKKYKIIFYKTNTSYVCLAFIFIWTRESDVKIKRPSKKVDAKSVLWIICGAVIYW